VTTAPFGSWPTPITSELVVAAAVRLSGLHTDGADVVWAEGRPAEGGRTQLVRRAPDGTTTDLLPDGMDARTAVHEYGGGAWWLRDGVVWFSDWSDQRLYRLAPGDAPEPLTPEPATPRGDRFADGDVAPDGATIVCVRERHEGSSATEVRNEIVRLAAHAPSEPEVLVSGPDFVAAPRLSPDGGTLAWVQWNHPSMPWDATELVVRDLRTGEETLVAGGPGESVSEPRWHPDGSLWFISDRTDWWNLYRWAPGADIEPVVRTDAEIGVAGWAFGSARYAPLADGRVVFARSRSGRDHLAVRDPDGVLTWTCRSRRSARCATPVAAPSPSWPAARRPSRASSGSTSPRPRRTRCARRAISASTRRTCRFPSPSRSRRWTGPARPARRTRCSTRPPMRSSAGPTVSSRRCSW
jgi:hypothetical protein